LSPNRGDAGEGTNRSGESTGESTSDGERSNRGSQSREIRCRGCDFDYPESADGAEGTAQVIVETDEQGQVISVTLSGSSGNPELDRAALEQARERVRLEGAKAGESYPIEVDFVQPGSEAAERVEERGSRNSITVSEPEPEPAPAAESPGTPETAANESPSPEPLSEPATAEPSLSPEAQPSSPDAANSQQPNSEQPSDADTLLNPPANPPTLPEALSPEPVPELAPEPAPEPEAEFIPEPEPAYVPELEPAPIAEPEPAYIPELESAPIAEPDFAPSSSESVE
jgi:TonB family protein